MINKLFLSAVCALSMSTMAAQSFDDGDVIYDFKPYNYLQFQAGVGHTVGEVDFFDLLSPAAQVGWGRQFSPVQGMRLSFGGWQGRGGWVNPYRKFKFNFLALNADYVVSITNLFYGWQPERRFNLNAFAGLAGNLVFDNDDVYPVGRAGLIADYRLTDRLSLNLEANANITSDDFNSKHGSKADWYFNGLLGLNYRFGKGYTKTYRELEPELIIVEICSVCESPVDECPYFGQHPLCEVCGRYIDDCEYCGNHPTPERPPVEYNIFFEKNKAIITDEQAVKMQEMADYLNTYPEATISLVGYADAATGNARVNARISKERAAAVAKYLVEQCGISVERISADWKGDTIQPFATNDDNRVCICVSK